MKETNTLMEDNIKINEMTNKILDFKMIMISKLKTY